MPEYGLVDREATDEPGDEWETLDVSETDVDREGLRQDRDFDEFRRRLTDADQFKVEGSVFDEATYAALYDLVQDGVLRAFGGPISTGKEANVYTAVGGRAAAEALEGESFEDVNARIAGDADATGTGSEDGAGVEPGNHPIDGPEVAVKVYRINASDFRDMRGYLEWDPRFEGLGDKKGIVLAWTRKEFATLRRAHAAGVRVPRPIAVERNVLVMELVGRDGDRARRLSEVTVENPETAVEVVREYMCRLHAAGIVHGDLSEYNLLVHDDDLYVIDLGQAVTTHHPEAAELLERDCQNVAAFFRRQGVDVTAEELQSDVEAAA